MKRLISMIALSTLLAGCTSMGVKSFKETITQHPDGMIVTVREGDPYYRTFYQERMWKIEAKPDGSFKGELGVTNEGATQVAVNVTNKAAEAAPIAAGY